MIYTALAPACAELAQMYIQLDIVLNETFADTASREYLIRRAAERGIIPKEATKAIVKGVFNLDVGVGKRFGLDDFRYTTTEQISTGVYKMECETVGSAPNGSTGRLIPIDYVNGLISAELTEVLIPGEDEEETEVFRSRYYGSIDSQAFGGNRADYKKKILELDGVGAVKIYRATDVSGSLSGGNVLIVILNSNYREPSEELVNSIQTILDPTENSGDGVGLAPMWHFVKVLGADEVAINIVIAITYSSGYSYPDIKSYVEAAIDTYLLSLAKSWQEESTLVVRVSQIEHALLGITGILDITGTTINGSTSNLELDKNAIPVRGTINGQ
jgi:uncharacterized phage protein gp47/JayE